MRIVTDQVVFADGRAEQVSGVGGVKCGCGQTGNGVFWREFGFAGVDLL